MLKVLEKNPKINTRKFIKLSHLGKASFYRYAQRLEILEHISHDDIKNERVWYLTGDKKDDLGMPAEESRNLEKRYQKIESKVIQSIQKVRKENFSEQADVYSNAVLLVLANLGAMKLVSIYRQKQVLLYYEEFVRKIELLLEKISDKEFFPHYGVGRIAIDGIAYDAESKLDQFLGIDPDEAKKGAFTEGDKK